MNYTILSNIIVLLCTCKHVRINNTGKDCYLIKCAQFFIKSTLTNLSVTLFEPYFFSSNVVN